MEDVLRKDGHEGDGSAEQDGEEVKRNGTEQDRGAADVPESGKDDVHGEGAVLHAAGADGKRGDKNQEPDEGDEGEEIDDRSSGDAVVKREREEDSAERGAGDSGDLEHGCAPGDGVYEVLFWNEMGNQRGAGGAAECAS